MFEKRWVKNRLGKGEEVKEEEEKEEEEGSRMKHGRLRGSSSPFVGFLHNKCGGAWDAK